MSTVKLITVPGRGVDLFSLKKNYGIRKGPVKSPVPITIEIIGELLNQYNYPEIYEVVVESVKKYPSEEKIYSAPVRLTRENYKQPYHVIAGIETEIKIEVVENPVSTITEPTEDTFQESVQPTESNEELSSEEEGKEVVDETVGETDSIQDEENTEEIDPIQEDIIDDSTETITKVDTDEEVGEAGDPILQLALNNNNNSGKKNKNRK